MDLETLKNENLEIAKEKGLGSEPEEILVPEKVVLIHSEISEAYGAFLKNELEGEHGFYGEMADSLLRTLHLAGIFGIIYANQLPVVLLPAGIHAQVALLHKILSKGYESYRHKQTEDFKTKLVELTSALVEMGRAHRFDLESKARQKMKKNRRRTWDKDGLNEKKA